MAKITASLTIKIEETTGEITTVARHVYTKVNDPRDYLEKAETTALNATRQVLKGVEGVHHG